MPNLPALALLLIAAPPPYDPGPSLPSPERTAGDEPREFSTLRAVQQSAWGECIFDRADALAGYARIAPERAAELAVAGCEQKAQAFRKMVAETTPRRGRAAFLGRVEAAMKRFALATARASAAFPP